jgi:hypothetical protein
MLVASPKQPLRLLRGRAVVAFLVAVGVLFLVLAPSFPVRSYSSFLDAWNIPSAFSWVALGLSSAAVIGLSGIWFSPRVTGWVASFGLWFCFTLGLSLFALRDVKPGGELAPSMFGGFMGALFGGLCALGLRWDDGDASQGVIVLVFGAFGIFATAGLVGGLSEVVPAIKVLFGYAPLGVLVGGGLFGCAAGGLLSSLLPQDKLDRAFKLSVCTLLTAVALRLAQSAALHIAAVR